MSERTRENENRADLWQPKTTEARGDTGALAKGLAIVDTLVAALRPMTAAEIAEALGMHNSTAHRLLQTLNDLGYVYRYGGKRYLAGPKAILPLDLYHPFNVLRREVHGPLQSLRDRFGVSAGFDLFLGDERVILELATTSESLLPFYNTHLRSPLHASVSGKLLLLRMSRKERERALGPGPYERLTPHTLTEPKELGKDLEEAARHGYALAVDQHYVGMTLIGAPVGLPSMPPIGCVGLAGNSARIDEQRLHEIGEACRDTARLLSAGSAGVRIVHSFLEG